MKAHNPVTTIPITKLVSEYGDVVLVVVVQLSAGFESPCVPSVAGE